MNEQRTIAFLPVASLLLGVLPLPYGYYTLLRLVVCLTCAFLAFQEWKTDETIRPWVVALGLVAILFNPVIPVHLTKGIWTVLDLASAAVIVVYWRGIGAKA